MKTEAEAKAEEEAKKADRVEVPESFSGFLVPLVRIVCVHGDCAVR